MKIWFTPDGTNWYPSGNPASGTGGIDLSAIAGDVLYMTGQGTGDSIQTFNFGASAFSYSVPSGFTAGLPHTGGGHTTFDATKVYGSGTLSNGNLTLSTPTVYGGAQTVDGFTTGSYYCEVTCGFRDVFVSGLGGGWGRNFMTGGGSFNSWPNGAFSGSDPNGGSLFTSGGLGNEQITLHALNSTITSGITPKYLQNVVVGIAMAFSPAPPVQSTVTIADLWFGNPGSFVDLTLVGNRRKFISEAGCTVNLNSDGSAPFGRSPAIFLTVPSGGVAAQFADNNGNGGDFIITGGTLALAGSMPCCTTTTLTVTNPPSLGVGVLGDYQNGNLYAFNMDTLLDNGTQRKWLRRWRALEKPREETTRFASLRVDMETGSPQNPPSTSPSVVLRYSDDGGHTWSAPRIIPAGPIGATAQNVKANMLGSTSRHARSDRIFELSSTDEMKIALVGAEIEVS